MVEVGDESSVQQQDTLPETESDDNLQSWLEKNSLEEYFSKMKACGLTEVVHSEVDAEKNFGMSTFQERRLLREYNLWKTTKAQISTKGKEIPHSSVPRLKTKNNAVVVSLPPQFQGFFGTRDGG